MDKYGTGSGWDGDAGDRGIRKRRAGGGAPARLLSLALAVLAASGLILTIANASEAKAAEESCSNEALRAAFGSVLLPECRAYEMVTPPYKEGYKFYVSGYSTSGEQAILTSLGDVASSPGQSEALERSEAYLDTRTSMGWQSVPWNPPSSEFLGQVPIAFEANAGISLWAQHTPEQSALVRELYSRSASGVFTPIGPLNPPVAGEEEPNEYTDVSPDYYDTPIGATGDYRHVVLSAFNHEDYWPFDPTHGEPSLYEYSGTGNKKPILVGVLGGAKGNTDLVSSCGTELGGYGSAFNALSKSGETIFFTPKPCEGGASRTEIYARLHGSMVAPDPAETVDISTSECTQDCGSSESGKNFEGASENGERVFFTSTQKLTNGAIDGTGAGNATEESGCAETKPSDGGCNLYEYDFAAPEGERLRVISEGGEVLGVAGIAENGARVYFVARRADTSAQSNPYGVRPATDGPNLYVYDTLTGATAFIVTLSASSDSDDWRRAFRRPVEVTGENGRFILFASAQTGLTPDDDNLHADMQLYEYSSSTQGESPELVRVTKGESGFNGDGNGVTVGVRPESISNATLSLGYGADFKTTTNLLSISQDGRTVAFTTAGELSPHAIASGSGCTSVYVFHSTGPLAHGVVHLLSDGTDVQPNKPECGAQFERMDGNGATFCFRQETHSCRATRMAASAIYTMRVLVVALLPLAARRAPRKYATSALHPHQIFPHLRAIVPNRVQNQVFPHHLSLRPRRANRLRGAVRLYRKIGDTRRRARDVGIDRDDHGVKRQSDGDTRRGRV